MIHMTSTQRTFDTALSQHPALVPSSSSSACSHRSQRECKHAAGAPVAGATCICRDRTSACAQAGQRGGNQAAGVPGAGATTLAQG